MLYKTTEKIIKQKLLENKGKQVSVIVENQLDIPRWRKFFHNQSDLQVLLSIQFYTVETFIRKKSAGLYLSNFESASHLQILHFITQLIETDAKAKNILSSLQENSRNISQKNLQEDLKEKTFSLKLAKQIAKLYSLSKWHKNLNHFFKKDDKQAATLYNFFTYVDEKIQKNKLLHEADYFKQLQYLSFEKEKEETEKQIIFWMFPYSLKIHNLHKLLRITELSSLYWNVFEFQKTPSQADEHLQTFLETLQEKKNLSKHVIAQQNIFSSENQASVKVYSGNNKDAEVTLVTRYVKNLLQQNISTDKILVLYSHSSLGNDFRLSFLQANIPVNIPVQKKLATTETGKFFSILIRIIAQLPVDNQDIADFFTSPLLNRFAFLLSPKLEESNEQNEEDNQKKYIYPSAWTTYLLEEISYHKGSLQEIIFLIESEEKRAVNNPDESDYRKETRKHLLETLSQLSKIATTEVTKEQKPSEWVFFIRTLLEKYCITGQELAENIRKQFFQNFQSLSKFLDQYQSLDAIYFKTQKLTQRLFCVKLLEDFEDVSTKFYGTRDNPVVSENSKKLPEVSCRPLQEGVGSFVDHVIVCGLNESHFPVQERGGEIFENPSLQKELGWFASVEKKIISYELALQLVQKNIVLTFADDDNKGPSRVIFSALQEMNPTLSSKKSLLKQVPLLSYTLGKFPKWNYSKDKQEVFSLPKLSKDILQTDQLNSQKEKPQNKYYKQAELKYQTKKFNKNTWSYFGKLDSANGEENNFTDKIFSATSIEDLAKCPQKFFFSNILNLEKTDSLAFDFSVNPLDRGSYFHKVAEKIFTPLIKDLEHSSYEKLHKHEKQWNVYVTESINHVYDNAVSKNSIQRKQLQKEKQNTLDYFQSFYRERNIKQQENTIVSLKDFRPWKTEHELRDIDLFGLKLNGRIDRIDIDEKNKKILLIDYKTGKKISKLDLEKHWNYFHLPQLALYMLALRQQFQEQPNLLPQWQEYSFSVAYLYVFTTVFTTPVRAIFPTEKEKKIKFYSLNKKDEKENVDERYLLQEIFGKKNNEINEKQNSKEKNNSNESSINSEQYKGEKFFEMFQQILQEKIFFSTHKNISRIEKIKPSPCDYCEFEDICDRKLFHLFQKENIPARYEELFFP